MCGTTPTVTELIDYEAFCGAVSEEASEAVKGSTISVTELADMLEERASGDRDFLLIDVREPAEWEIVSIPGAQLIPKGEFLSGAALADLPQHKPIVVHCKAGVRSAEVLAVLKNAGSPTPSTSAAGSSPGSTRSSPTSRRTEASCAPVTRECPRSRVKGSGQCRMRQVPLSWRRIAWNCHAEWGDCETTWLGGAGAVAVEAAILVPFLALLASIMSRSSLYFCRVICTARATS